MFLLKLIVSDASNSRYKCGGINFVDGQLYWSGNMIIQDGVILASHCAPASAMAAGIIVALDLGKTWAQYDLQKFGKRSPWQLFCA